MDTSVVEKIPVSSLFPDRYGKGKTKVYEFLKDLGVERIYQGKEAFISLEDLHDLDEYVRCAGAGDRLGMESLQRRRGRVLSTREPLDEQVHAYGEFVQVNSEPVREPVQSVQAGEIDGGLVQQMSQSPAWMMLIEAIAQRVQVQQRIDPLTPQEQLERAAQHQWLLATDQVRSIIGVKPHGLEFRRYGFVLVRSGRCGAQAAWLVRKGVD